MTAAIRPHVVDARGAAIPLVGLGTWALRGRTCARVVERALRLGYRHVDTAEMYDNEREVGEGLRASGIRRDQAFIATKVWPSHFAPRDLERSARESLVRLRLAEVDLLLLHWPNPRIPLSETLGALCKVKRDGLARHIGVSNFTEPMLTEIIDATGVTPAVNQVELHPYFPQAALRAFHAEHGIRTESWSPLARRSELLTEQLLQELGVVHDVTPTQIVLRWNVQLGSTPIPKSGDPDRQRENADVFGFTLTDDHVAAISALERGRLWGGDPDTHEEM